MHWNQYVLPILISAFTGWFVIWITTKILFRPLIPYKIMGLKILGIIPANQQNIARKIGGLVSKEIFSFSALEEKFTDPENFNKLKPEIELHIDSFLRERLKDTFPMLSMLIGDKTINQLKTAFLVELESLFPVLLNSYLTNLNKDLNIENIVTQKIIDLPSGKIDELIYNSAKKQLAKVQIIGAIIGVIMGLIHIFINTQLYS